MPFNFETTCKKCGKTFKAYSSRRTNCFDCSVGKPKNKKKKTQPLDEIEKSPICSSVRKKINDLFYSENETAITQLMLRSLLDKNKDNGFLNKYHVECDFNVMDCEYPININGTTCGLADYLVRYRGETYLVEAETKPSHYGFWRACKVLAYQKIINFKRDKRHRYKAGILLPLETISDEARLMALCLDLQMFSYSYNTEDNTIYIRGEDFPRHLAGKYLEFKMGQ